MDFFGVTNQKIIPFLTFKLNARKMFCYSLKYEEVNYEILLQHINNTGYYINTYGVA
jgi:hypothetical protein